jgi:hypothetical protein
VRKAIQPDETDRRPARQKYQFAGKSSHVIGFFFSPTNATVVRARKKNV